MGAVLPRPEFRRLGEPDPLQAKAWVERLENAGLDKIYNFGLAEGWASRDLNASTMFFLWKEARKLRSWWAF